MSTHNDPHQITGYTSQLAGSSGYAFTNMVSTQPHGNPGPHDKRPGYLSCGEPGGIDPVISAQKKGSPAGTAKNPYGDPTAVGNPTMKRGWTSQGH